MSNWYEKCMPCIKEIKPLLPNISKKIKKIKGVKDVYIWGSYSENCYKPNFRIKDLDILVKTSFNSQDLISIDKEIMVPFI